MKNNNYLKIIFIFSILIISSVSVKSVSIVCGDTKMQGDIEVHRKLPTPRALIPRSVEGRIAKVKRNFKQQKNSNSNSNFECNRNLLCGSFDTNTTKENVSAWMGFEFKSRAEKYFIATYGQVATQIGKGIYSTPKWDKRHFWMHIGKDIVPFPIQPRFVGIDEESGNEWYTVDYVGYRMADAGIDYSIYWENMSESALILLINPKTKKVEEYYLEYYDENDEYIGDYDIKIGDEIESYFVGFRKGQEDREYFFFLEDITPITAPLTFSYEELYPGKDFNSTYGKDLNLAEVEFKYIFESYGKIRSSFTEPQPILSKSNTPNNLKENTTKSVPLSGFWMLFFLITIVGIIKYQQDKKGI